MIFQVPTARLTDIDADRICVIKPSAFGDIVQALPLLPVLRARFPESHLAWVVKRELADLVTGHPCLDEVIAVDFRSRWSQWARILTDFRQRKFDLVFDLQGLARTACFTAVSGAALRVGMETAREGANLPCNCLIENTGRHLPAHARYRHVAETLGIGLQHWQTLVLTSAKDRSWSRRQVNRNSGLVVAIHTGARWPTKQWPVAKFAALASRAMGSYSASIILIGGREDRALGGQLESTLAAQAEGGSVLNLIGQSSLKQLAALLGDVDLLVSNDSGPMHLAAGMGTPVLGTFTCTDPHLSGPPGKQHEWIHPTQLPCSSCYKKTCPLPGSRQLACLQQDDIDQAWQAFQKLVQKNRLARPAA